MFFCLLMMNTARAQPLVNISQFDEKSGAKVFIKDSLININWPLKR